MAADNVGKSELDARGAKDEKRGLHHREQNRALKALRADMQVRLDETRPADTRIHIQRQRKREIGLKLVRQAASRNRQLCEAGGVSDKKRATVRRDRRTKQGMVPDENARQVGRQNAEVIVSVVMTVTADKRRRGRLHRARGRHPVAGGTRLMNETADAAENRSSHDDSRMTNRVMEPIPERSATLPQLVATVATMMGTVTHGGRTSHTQGTSGYPAIDTATGLRKPPAVRSSTAVTDRSGHGNRLAEEPPDKG